MSFVHQQAAIVEELLKKIERQDILIYKLTTRGTHDGYDYTLKFEDGNVEPKITEEGE